jgi:PHD/YefM family antitoxin component YafN of YafNO toxin-antitoxin module
MRVTAEELGLDLDRLAATVRREPVHISGREAGDFVLIAADEYRRLKERETRALRIAELPADRIRAMLEADLGHLRDDPDEDGAWRL